MKNFFNRLIRMLYIVLISLIFGMCNREKYSRLKTGEFYLDVPGGRIWYKVSGTGSGIPLVVLHGGPGFSSFYLKPFEELGIRYDQLGAGKSDVISDTSMFTIGHFVKELEMLRKHLKAPKWHIMGHSWGTILALEYFRTYPDNVSSLTFGSLCIDIPAFRFYMI